MNWHRLTVASVMLTSIALPIATIGEASAQSRNPQCVMITPSGEHILLNDPDACRQPVIRPILQVQPAPVVQSVVNPENHSFELFNNSDQDIDFLHIYPVNRPEDVKVYGGSRSLLPGRAWSVELSEGCEYNILAEYEDSSQQYYEAVDTCAHRGIQLQ